MGIKFERCKSRRLTSKDLFYFSFLSLGFLHEHSRIDRSKYIDVDMNAIHQYESKNFWPQGYFAKQYKTCSNIGCKPFNYFDLKSIMMYGSLLPGTNLTVIKTKTLCDGKECEIGQRRELSFLDIKDISSAYNCGMDELKL